MKTLEALRSRQTGERPETPGALDTADAPGAHPLPPAYLAALRAAAAGWLAPGRQTVVAAAPGRLDVMGGIADYSGAVVLEGTIGDLAVVALQRREDDRLRVRTVGPETGRLAERELTLRLADFYVPGAAPAPDGPPGTGGRPGGGAEGRRGFSPVPGSLADRPPLPARASPVGLRPMPAPGLARPELGCAQGRPRVAPACWTGGLRPYEAVRRLFPEPARWAAYVLGVFYVLLAEGELAAFPGGADLLLHSTVPLGAGVASSAAVEVAAMRAVAAAYGAPTAGLRLAALCQIVENRVVGAPCGIMDQVTCTLGRAGQLLALRCQPHDVLGWQAPPAGYGFAGLDSGVKHAVGGRRYGRVRCAAFMGRRIIGEHAAGDPEHSEPPGRVGAGPGGGPPGRSAYLADLAPAEFRARFRDLLPRRLAGREFLERWGETGDSATAVDADEVYPVRGATEHPIYENDRVLRFAARLREAGRGGAAGRRRALLAAGRLMYGSHRSYSRSCGLGSKETDLLVALVRRQGAEAGLFGAKITGGGSGGTVAVLLEAGPGGAPSARAAEALRRVGAAYAREVGRPPRLITGSQPGAAGIAPLVLEW